MNNSVSQPVVKMMERRKVKKLPWNKTWAPMGCVNIPICVKFFLLSWEYMWVGIIKPHKKFGNVLSKILEVPAIFVFTKEFPKNTKEKMP
jgi:hypothetical protein